MRTRTDTTLWTERTIQNALYCHCAIKRHELIVPNSGLFGWESDLISVTKAGFIYEFEIKITRSDFRADAKKTRTGFMVNPERTRWGRPASRANYFYYVTPPGLVTV